MKITPVRHIYKKGFFSGVEDMNNTFDLVDTFENLSKCTRISHVMSGNIVEENLCPHSIISVKRTNNFFINLN